MKKFFLLSLSVVLFSCQHLGTKERTHLDTFSIAKYSLIAPNGKKIGPFYDTAIIVVRWQMQLSDTTHGSGFQWVSDTPSRYGRISDDTLRTPDHKPIFDTSHRPVFHYAYYPIPDSLFTPIIHYSHKP